MHVPIQHVLRFKGWRIRRGHWRNYQNMATPFTRGKLHQGLPLIPLHTPNFPRSHLTRYIWLPFFLSILSSPSGVAFLSILSSPPVSGGVAFRGGMVVEKLGVPLQHPGGCKPFLLASAALALCTRRLYVRFDPLCSSTTLSA